MYCRPHISSQRGISANETYFTVFAQENTACKHEKTTNKSKYFARQSAGKWKVTVDLAIQLVIETDFFEVGQKTLFSVRLKNSKKMDDILFRTFAQGWFISVCHRGIE